MSKQNPQMSQKLALLSRLLQKEKKSNIGNSKIKQSYIQKQKNKKQTIQNHQIKDHKSLQFSKEYHKQRVQENGKSKIEQPKTKQSSKNKQQQKKEKQKQKKKEKQKQKQNKRSKSKKQSKKSKIIFQKHSLRIQDVAQQPQNNHNSMLDSIFPKLLENQQENKQINNQNDIKTCRRSKFFHPALQASQKVSQYQKLWVLGAGKVKDQFQITSWNINGIRSQKASKMLNLYLKDSNPEILYYDAYKLKPIHIEGYNDYWSFCKCSSGYSGVAVFSKYLPLKVAEDLPQKQFSQEGRVLTLQFQHFFVIAVYVPAAGDHLQRLFYKVKQFQVAFHRYCNRLKQTKNVIICGDLNVARNQIDASISKTTQKGQGYTILQRKSLQSFLNTGWIDTYRYFHPSKKTISWFNFRRYGQKAIQLMKGKRLDYFLVNENFMKVIKSSDVLMKITGRDHCPIQLRMIKQRDQNR